MPPQFIPPETKIFPLEERLRGCHELAEYVWEAFGGPLPGDGHGERLILAVWARAAGTFSGVLLLAEPSYGDQVGMLARALFEGTVDAYWIAKHPVKAQRLATLHFRQTRLLVAEHWNEHDRRDGDPVLPLFSEDIRDRQQLASLFGAIGHRHWTGQWLPKRIAEVDSAVPQEHDGELFARYGDDNKLANLLLHGAAVALNDRITDGPYGATIHAGPSQQHLANGLRHAYWSYQRLCLLVADRPVPSARPRIEELYLQTWSHLQTITVPALKLAGRNGRCPCGSGRKVEDCHGAL
jgi:Family of unknown function (DUF5677)